MSYAYAPAFAQPAVTGLEWGFRFNPFTAALAPIMFADDVKADSGFHPFGRQGDTGLIGYETYGGRTFAMYGGGGMAEVYPGQTGYGLNPQFPKAFVATDNTAGDGDVKRYVKDETEPPLNGSEGPRGGRRQFLDAKTKGFLLKAGTYGAAGTAVAVGGGWGLSRLSAGFHDVTTETARAARDIPTAVGEGAGAAAAAAGAGAGQGIGDALNNALTGFGKGVQKAAVPLAVVGVGVLAFLFVSGRMK